MLSAMPTQTSQNVCSGKGLWLLFHSYCMFLDYYLHHRQEQLPAYKVGFDTFNFAHNTSIILLKYNCKGAFLTLWFCYFYLNKGSQHFFYDAISSIGTGCNYYQLHMWQLERSSAIARSERGISLGGRWRLYSAEWSRYPGSCSLSAFLTARLARKQHQKSPGGVSEDLMTEHAVVFTNSLSIRRYSSFLCHYTSCVPVQDRLCNILRHWCCLNELTSQLSSKTKATFSLWPEVRFTLQILFLICLRGIKGFVWIQSCQPACHRALPLQVSVSQSVSGCCLVKEASSSHTVMCL